MITQLGTRFHLALLSPVTIYRMEASIDIVDMLYHVSTAVQFTALSNHLLTVKELDEDPYYTSSYNQRRKTVTFTVA